VLNIARNRKKIVARSARRSQTRDVATWVIVGCGYTGRELARRLVAEGGHELVVTRRDAAAAAAIAAELGPPVRGMALDLGRELPALPAGAIVACLAPPGPDPAGEIARLAAACDRLIYVSSTGVYGAGHGAWVDESWPLAPITREGAARVAAERALPGSAIALRAAGIYGPGRGLVDRMRAGTYRIVGDGSAHVSRIHVADLAQAIIDAGARPHVTGAINIADDSPDPIGIVADSLAAQLGVAPPPRIDPSVAGEPAAGMLLADRRIANARMKRELGVALRYPSWRDALA
jgi:nucleoside-diphosphate-sugar epimerase